MDKILNKYVLAFIYLGIIFLLLPGFCLYLLDYIVLGRILMLAYVIPLGVWAVVALIWMQIDLFRDWKNLD